MLIRMRKLRLRKRKVPLRSHSSIEAEARPEPMRLRNPVLSTPPWALAEWGPDPFSPPAWKWNSKGKLGPRLKPEHVPSFPEPSEENSWWWEACTALWGSLLAFPGLNQTIPREMHVRNCKLNANVASMGKLAGQVLRGAPGGEIFLGYPTL